MPCIACLHTHITCLISDSSSPPRKQRSTHSSRRSRSKTPPSTKKHYKRREPKDTPHFSHLARRRAMARGQAIPGYCKMCPNTFMGVNEKEMLAHMTRVHTGRARIFGDLYLAMCKCTAVKPRGTDGTLRNSHHHCPVCHKPCEGPNPLRVHILGRHDVAEADLWDIG